MDMELDRGWCAAYVREHGWDAFLAALEWKSQADLGLYSVSTEWLDSDDVHCLKARGKRGDLLAMLV